PVDLVQGVEELPELRRQLRLPGRRRRMRPPVRGTGTGGVVGLTTRLRSHRLMLSDRRSPDTGNPRHRAPQTAAATHSDGDGLYGSRRTSRTTAATPRGRSRRTTDTRALHTGVPAVHNAPRVSSRVHG